MLELKNIKKDYPAGNEVVHALKGVNLCFRNKEFVSILGPSGCGKTTMLNIIGGLDQYSSGDLLINGKSTKEFKDRDWDAYRNHSIGFVFQSYNLIPHQTVLQNVELALTLSGIPKSERKQRAMKALEQVGLSSQINKKPKEMSGGQMQRVAIARALVNDPEIILADEPTGALDSETSVQVMEILKEISKEKLIIMVTHNPELAEKYSTRIIHVLDGEIKADSDPLTDQEKKVEAESDKEKEQIKKSKKIAPSMSFGTSFSLSLKNLRTKRGRSILTSFAGSIGIIGIALILAVSQGMTGYINHIQEETLSSYPLTLEEESIDISSLMQTFMMQGNSEVEHEKDAVYTKSAIYDMVDALGNMEESENDLKAFKTYLNDEVTENDDVKQAISGIQYTYNIDMQVLTQSVDGKIIVSDTEKLLQSMMSDYMGVDMTGATENGAMDMMSNSSMSSMRSAAGGISTTLWQEMIPGRDGEPVNDMLKKQYDVVYGEWPDEYNEIILVLDENNELDDMTLYALGLESEEQINAIMDAAKNKQTLEKNDATWSYEELCNMEFHITLPSQRYSLDEATGLYKDLCETDSGLQYLYENGEPLHVTGIIRKSEDVQSPILSGTIGYTSELTDFLVKQAKDSKAVEAQKADNLKDIFTGLPFQENTGNLNDEEKQAEFLHYISTLSEKEKAETYVNIMSIPSKEQLDEMIDNMLSGMDRASIEQTMTQGMIQQMGMNENSIAEYLGNMSDEELISNYKMMLQEQAKMQYAQGVQQKLQSMSEQEQSLAMDASISGFSQEQCALFYDEVLEFSDSTYEDNMDKLGNVDMNKPSSINLYASSFENKEVIEEMIKEYNEEVDDIEEIHYTDFVGTMMDSVNSIINTITYVLIAFVAISLIVSSIMIAVITLISVQERTKEIGILRAMGASKRDVSSMFNAETMIIGFSSGVLGVLVTYLLCIPINIVIHKLTGINTLNAFLPIPAAIVLILLSVFLNIVSGVIPSKSAAKKDPVVALRSE